MKYTQKIIQHVIGGRAIRKETNHWEDQDIGGWILLRWTLDK
jgi:hypothetical protein